MKIKAKLLRLALVISALLLLNASPAFSQGTTFTYQGQLIDGGQAANGTNYGMTFYLYNVATGGSALANEGIVSVTASNGLFTVPLNFGDEFSGGPLWLEIAVQKNSGPFTTLTPRQQITPAPYAIFANSASNVTGSISLANLPSAVITNNEAGVNFSGTFTGNAGGLTNLNAANLTGTIADAQLSTNVALLRIPGIYTPEFLPVQFVSAPNLYQGLAAADVNGDGSPDLIAGEEGALAVFTNNGAGLFSQSQTLSITNFPLSVTVADVNGDGFPDLICANYGPIGLQVFTNNGSGGFTQSQYMPISVFASSMVAADVNGDNHIDLILTDESTDVLLVLTNSGNGKFSPAQTVTVGTEPTMVAAADINGDGHIDLISANYNGESFSIITNDGTGKFTLSQTIPCPYLPICVAAVDVNGDGKMDLIGGGVNPSGGGDFIILTNNGSGTLVQEQTNTLPGIPYTLATADFNGDGHVDFAASAPNNNIVLLMTNNGSGQFARAKTVSTGNGAFIVATADFNGDGVPDLAVGNQEDENVEVLLAAIPGLPSATGNQIFSGINDLTNAANILAGNGSQLTDLNASSLTNGTLSQNVLPTNVAFLGNNQNFTAENLFTSAGNYFVGDGSGLFDLNGSGISSGTVSDVFLSTNVSFLENSQTFKGLNRFTNTANVFDGNGAGLTSLNASNISTGTISDARQSTNVALLTASQTFTGAHNFTGNVGIGTNNPQAALQVTTASAPCVLIDGSYQYGTWLDIRNTTGGTNWALISTGSGNGEGAGKLLFDTASSIGSTSSEIMALSSSGVSVYGTFNNNSDRNAKQDISAVTPSQILEKVSRLPVSEWSYKVDAGTKHIGPMAQDFYSAFNVGTDDKHIAPIDEGGVALAAIQGLQMELAAKDAKFADDLKAKDEKIDELEQRLNELQQSLEKSGVLK